ncbi:zinc finger MYM-type protein 4-like isoform X2 [Solea senegalensis]|uniref:Zinc finger MYM-type protein 4-like isoform X2 n=1 Tax=Solea senegalensis TaxID=28829 RepID=A0AAV6RZ96_SOLSE|nr:zinc finger MYM-type protein 4-like isoform X2 [Solea senegalensis]KAG7510776.1 zinc finger MYM-type protein 4-like isoform X2 [Solea senegalensis]
MADSEEFRLKRLKHEQHLSRVFDEVMGLGDFAESSRGSASSSRSGGQDETKEVDETSGKEEPQQAEEEDEEEEEEEEEEDDSNSSKQEEKIEEPVEEPMEEPMEEPVEEPVEEPMEEPVEEAVEEPSFPPVSSSSSDRPSLFAMRRKKGGGSGGAAFDDALDGLPMYGPEEEDEDWHFALPVGSLEDVDVEKKKRQQIQAEEGNDSSVDDSSAPEPKGEEEEVREKGESTESANTSHSSQDPTPENSRDTGILNHGEDTEDSQEGERSAAGAEYSNPPMSPTVNIKDEPIDEGYDAALLPQSSIKQVKEELEHQEEELRISSVYSVGGANTFVAPTVPPVISAPPSTAIFIPGRGAVLQAMASLPVRPTAQITTSLPTLVPAPPRPPLPPLPAVPGSVRCSGCSKVLLKGQTAFQRKGSTQLFCSTVCLTGHLPPAAKNKICFQCNKEILQPRDMITIPSDENTYLYFCGQFCLSVFRHKKKNDKIPDKRLEKKPVEKVPEKPAERQLEKPFCSVCRVTGKIEHEVTHQGRLHRLCSDACFVTWRKIRQLAMNCCEGCGLYCNSNSGSCQTLTIDRTERHFCGPTCISTYKQSCRKTIECVHCRKRVVVSSTIMERDQKGKVQLYCSSACVVKSRPSRHTLSGTAFPCSLCKVSAVPQYHLAMVDSTIRNFCSYDCVTLFRKSGQTSHPDLTNGTSSLRDGPKTGLSAGAGSVPPNPQDNSSSAPYTSPYPSHTSVPPLVPPYPAMSSPTVPGQNQARAPALPQKSTEDGQGVATKLTCHQCSSQFNTKPQLYSHQGRISVFCSVACSQQYKIQKNILAQCESCKQEKVPFDIFNYNQQDVVLCSETCLRLFKQGQKVRYKDHPWRPCSYCCGINHKMLHSHYGGKIEEFCKPHCMSQYTVLFYGMGRCDSCRKQGYMTEKLQCLGSVRNFCNLPCLLQYCHYHFEPNQNTSCNGTEKAPQTPYGTLPNSSTDIKNLDHASTQTDAMRVPVPRRRQMKNKSVLCRPFTVDQESMCELPAASTESEATSSEREEKVKVVMVPVPVPVFIPVPMNMYSQHTPVPVALPMPFPVPLVAPPQNKDMKDAAVQSEPLAVDEVKLNAQPVVSADQSSCSRDTQSQVKMCEDEDAQQKAADAHLPLTASLETSTETVDAQPDTQPETHADTQQDAQTETQQDSQPDKQPDTRLESQPDAQSDSHPDTQPDSQSERQPDTQPDSQPDTQSDTTMATEPPPTTSAEPQPPLSPMMDLETDFPSEPVAQKSSAPKRGVKRAREGSSSRKRGRRRNVSVERSAVEIPPGAKLNHLYGVKAWKSWVQQRNTLPPESNQMDIKEDILQCDSAELSFALSRFISEVRRPNGETYSPDSIFYLCLGIQQYLFMKGRIENIFTDELYVQFATEISGMLQNWKPKLLQSGDIVSSRVEEAYLWECKQLGAYSPIVLLNTLLFFFTKTFHLNTLQQHQNVSFVNFTRCSRPCSRAGKVFYLQYRGGGSAAARRDDTERLRKRPTESEGHLEILENVANPLHCPVRLYEFYLSRCPESAKKRSDVFYLQPERNVHTHSPHWYTSQPLEGATLQSMLTRILAVKEVHQAHGAAQCPTSGCSGDSSSQ